MSESRGRAIYYPQSTLQRGKNVLNFRFLLNVNGELHGNRIKENTVIPRLMSDTAN